MVVSTYNMLNNWSINVIHITSSVLLSSFRTIVMPGLPSDILKFDQFLIFEQ
jgi:hypothetical protein